MLLNSFKSRGVIAALVGLVSTVFPALAVAQCGGHGGHGGHADHVGHGDLHEECASHLPNAGLPLLQQQTPHGGQLLETKSNAFEVVYLPGEVRVYLYGSAWQPLNTLGMKGFLLPHPAEESSSFPMEFQQAAPGAPGDEGYLVAKIDPRHWPDKTPVTFVFEKLPDRRHSKAEFSPIFLQSQLRPYVAVVALVPGDRAGVLQQKTCPITGEILGRMGPPAKVLVGERPIFLCCPGCLGKVREDHGRLGLTER